MLEGKIVGAAVAGYAFARFSHVTAVQRWAQSDRLPFFKLWDVVRHESPVPERRLMLHGELLQVLGDALLRENYRTRQYEEAAARLNAASAAKDEFLAVLSHELRAPLAPIVGWANVMKHSENMADVCRAAEAIERNALLQSRLVDDLLDTNRIMHRTIRLDLQTQDLSVLLRAAVEVNAQEVKNKAIALEFTGATGPLWVRGDGGRLEQVFRNILSNAVKFTPRNGSVHVALSRQADSAQVLVTDTGAGIAPEFLPFVFDLFRQQEEGLRRQHEGLGIGLALVKQLTDLHQGTVSIASRGVDLGTEVTLRFPLVAASPDVRDAAAEMEAQASALAGLSVLVVDDSDDARECLTLLLQRLGVTVSVARDGREALDTIQGISPDMVLCDLRMPRMDGYEFLRELHRSPAPIHPPVVAMSGLASDADFRRTREAGFEAHIKKPFDASAIIVAVNAAVRRRKEQQPGEQTRIPSSPGIPQTTPPAETAPRPAERAERRRNRLDAGKTARRSAQDRSLPANGSDSRKSGNSDPKRQP